MLKDNLKKVQTNIKSACERAGRKPEEVTLVAVSKMKPLSDIEELLETGQMEYGENYVRSCVRSMKIFPNQYTGI